VHDTGSAAELAALLLAKFYITIIMCVCKYTGECDAAPRFSRAIPRSETERSGHV